jgi:hypothetical protein
MWQLLGFAFLLTRFERNARRGRQIQSRMRDEITMLHKFLMLNSRIYVLEDENLLLCCRIFTLLFMEKKLKKGKERKSEGFIEFTVLSAFPRTFQDGIISGSHKNSLNCGVIEERQSARAKFISARFCASSFSPDESKVE